MKEVDLIISQEQLKQNKINKTLIEKTKENKNKQNKLNEVCKDIILLGTMVIVVLFLMHMFVKLTDSGFKGCMENGYSETYCRQHS